MLDIKNENKLLINVDKLSFFADSIEKNDESCRIKILDKISVKINKGEFVAILGKNGAGKSTFVKHLNALLLPSKGDVFIDGINTKNKNELFKIRSKVGMVLQDPDMQIVNSVVKEDIAFGLENLQVRPEEINRLVDKALSLVDMVNYKNSLVEELSGGKKQRVAIAGVLAMHPECLILDESTSMLDYKSRNKILKIIRKLNKQHGTTIIMVTHNVEETLCTNRVLYMEDGKIVLDISPLELFYNDFLLKKYKIDTPEIIQLVKKLKNKGLNLPINILNANDCIRELEIMLNKESKLML